MKIKKFIVNPFQINCYLYYDENNLDAVLIDPAAYGKGEQETIISYVLKNEINIKYILNTHGHIDHILGNHFAREIFKAPLLIHKDDLFFIENLEEQCAMFGLDVISSPLPDSYITEKLVLKVGENKIEFIHTPGHTPGSVCIINHKDGIVFTGDLIFNNSIGRTDLPGGDTDILLDSIFKKLFVKCSNNYVIYPGHYEETTIGEEKKNNPFL